MRCALLAAFSAAMALAQPSIVLDDLEQRALHALNQIQRPGSWAAIQTSRNALQRQLADAIGLESVPSGRAIAASVYLPKNTAGRVPGVIILRTHAGPTDAGLGLLATALAQLAFLVVELDARTDHSTLNQLAHGVTPQGLIQQDVRSVLAYLKANTAVDASRVGLVGEGLAATLAAAMNPEVAAAVVLDGAPDLATVIKDLRAVTSNEPPDSCVLLPGILRFAASQEILSLIAPRPLLLMNAADGPLAYATDLYRMAGERALLSHRTEDGWSPSARFSACAWLARHLSHRSELTDFVPPANATEPSELKLTSLEVTRQQPDRVQMSEHSLMALLGPALLEGKFTFGLNCHSGPSVYHVGNPRVQFYPQLGIAMPVTVLRPGPTGCDASRGTLIAVNDRGRSELVNDEIVQEANRRGWIVWMLDPRYTGELAVPSGPFASAVSLLLGEHMAWRQSHDIIRTLRHVGGSRYPTAIYARGPLMGLAASYVAAIADRRELEWTALRDAASSFGEMIGSPLTPVPFGALKIFDIPDLWKASRGAVHTIHSPEEFISKEW